MSIAGALLVAVALRDVFHTLFHPEGRGSLSAAVQRALWRAVRAAGRRRPGALGLAGPVIVVAVIIAWLALVVAGWTLVYLPWMPGDVLVAEGLSPEAQGGVLDALYLSLVTVATLGYGDIVPQADWLRIVAPLQALVGFAILTAAISWVLSIYPALSRSRGLAAELSSLAEVADEPERALSSEGLRDVLRDLVAGLTAVRGDLAQFPVVHYFDPRDARYSLAETLPVAGGLAGRLGEDPDPDVRTHARRLAVTLDRFAETLGARFHGMAGAGTDEVLARYRDERRPRPR